MIDQHICIMRWKTCLLDRRGLAAAKGYRKPVQNSSEPDDLYLQAGGPGIKSREFYSGRTSTFPVNGPYDYGYSFESSTVPERSEVLTS